MFFSNECHASEANAMSPRNMSPLTKGGVEV